MKKIFHSKISLIVCFVIFSITGTMASGQATTNTTVVPQADPNTLPILNQFNYVQDHTKIYENFRAVREDNFQRLKKNVADTINNLHKQMNSLNYRNAGLNSRIDSLNSSLSTTKSDLAELTRTKESIRFFGMEVDKGTYNSIMWSIIIVLLLLLVIGFLVFKRNQNVVNARNSDLNDLRAEFDAYRKTSRETREKMALQHFNELKKLRGE